MSSNISLEPTQTNRNKTTMCFQYTVPGVLSNNNNNEPIFSPPFATHTDTFWQLKFTPGCTEYPGYCSLALFWIRNPKEQRSGELSNERLRIKKAFLFVKNCDSNQLVEKKLVNITSFRKRWPGQGWGNFAQKAYLSDRTAFGVEFEMASLQQQDEITLIPNESYPNTLKVAWKEQLELSSGSNVQFNIDGHTLYASSIILSKRSEYFKNMFRGDWSEKSVDNNLDNAIFEELFDIKPELPIPSSSSKSSIKYKIDVSDCNFEIFKDMLVFLYTDQVPFTNANDRDQLSLAIEIFSVADKYLIADLRHKAMQVIWESLTDDKAAEVLFTVALNWPDLKECVLEYVVTRFNSVRKTDTFKRIKTHQSSYPGAGEVFAELLLKLVPDS